MKSAELRVVLLASRIDLWVWKRWVEDGAWILDDVTVRVALGSRIGIIGKNGAGKSTLLAVPSFTWPQAAIMD